MTYLLLLCGLSLSAIAAYYSVMGLIAIFAAAATPIAVMGTALEASKLVAASWLYRSWNAIPKLLKIYFTTAVVVLMLLTSMGIFGYLSKAHLDQAVPTGDVAAKVALLDEKIKTSKDNIDDNRKALKQLDEAVDQVMARSESEKGADKAVALRKAQQAERKRILADIEAEQKRVSVYNEERVPIATELRKVEAEVGPIKYIAALIYGEGTDTNTLESAVRIVIIMIVFVFDPLAVLLLIAANREMVKGGTIEKPREENYDWYTGFYGTYKPPEETVEPPKAEPPKPLAEETKKVVDDFFAEEKKPEAEFVLNPDFDQKDPWHESLNLKPKKVIPNSRRQGS